MSGHFHYYDEGALRERLTKGVLRRSQEVIFLVGAPLSAPLAPGRPGVPDVEGVISLIRQEFADDSAQFEQALNGAGSKRYQTAFQFLQGRRGQQAANEYCSHRGPRGTELWLCLRQCRPRPVR